MHNPLVICFGEILWDLLPSGKIAGGAPMNVAFQTNNLGMSSRMISRVGEDALGKEFLDFLQQKGISTDLVQIDSELPTGAVDVSLDEKGVASYTFVQPAAWDQISLAPEVLDLVSRSNALVFGSLSCRSATTKKTLLALLEKAPLKVFDINLRQPYYDQELLDELLPKANIIKLNDLELAILAEWYKLEGPEEEQLRALQKKYGFERIIVTKGELGAASLSRSGYYSTPGIPIQVQDTVGSGDAFLSGYLDRLFAGAGDAECLSYANALGALTATKAGGTPNIAPEEIRAFLQSLPEKVV